MPVVFIGHIIAGVHLDIFMVNFYMALPVYMVSYAQHSLDIIGLVIVLSVGVPKRVAIIEQEHVRMDD